MSHTEQEAREKWCPHARVVNSAHMAGNRAPFDTDYSERKAFACCIASDCMAWRWVNDGFEYATTRNLTDDQEQMAKRIKTHPTELSIWKKPEGEPPQPPGGGWEPDGEMQQARNYAAGTFERNWKRPVNGHGYCGLARSPS